MLRGQTLRVSQIRSEWVAECQNIVGSLPPVLQAQYWMGGHDFDLTKEKLVCFTQSELSFKIRQALDGGRKTLNEARGATRIGRKLGNSI